MKNTKLTEEIKRKISISLRGKSKSEKHKRKISETRKRLFKEGKLKMPFQGRNLPQEIKDKMSLAHRGKKFSEEHRRNMSISRKGKHYSSRTEFKKGCISWLKGKRLPEEIKKRLSLNRKGIHLSKETKEKISKSLKGLKRNPFTEEHKKKMSESHKGHVLSKETKEKLSRVLKGNIRLIESHKGKIPWNKGKPGLIMEKNPMWKGGKSFEPYGIEFNKKLKEFIRKRDDYICQECGITQEQLDYQLHIHHIDYNKNNNSLLNLISLCNPCHIKTNKDRQHWTNYFKMKMFIKELFNPQNILIFNENKQLIGVEKILR